MTIAVLLILLVLWVAVLAPPVVRYLSGERRSVDSVGSFNETLSVLQRTHGSRSARSRSHDARGMSPAQSRRRDVLLGLIGAVVGSFALAVLFGGVFLWGLQLLADALLAGYVLLLVQFKQRTIEREAKVRYLPERTDPVRELAALRRTASR